MADPKDGAGSVTLAEANDGWVTQTAEQRAIADLTARVERLERLDLDGRPLPPEPGGAPE